MDWLCTVEFIPEDNGEARLFATEIIGHLFGYAQAMQMPTPTSCCSLLHLLKAKSSFLHLVRTNEDMGNDYIENDFMSPMAEEIRNARPLGMVLPPDVCQPCRPDCGNSLCVPRGQSRGILNSRHWSLPLE